MAEDREQDAADAVAGMMIGLGAQLSAAMGEALAPERWQYELVPWARVNELAADGWKLMAADADLAWFVMCRQLGPADAAAELLKQAAAEQAFGLPQPDLRITMPGEST